MKKLERFKMNKGLRGGDPRVIRNRSLETPFLIYAHRGQIAAVDRQNDVIQALLVHPV